MNTAITNERLREILRAERDAACHALAELEGERDEALWRLMRMRRRYLSMKQELKASSDRAKSLESRARRAEGRVEELERELSERGGTQ